MARRKAYYGVSVLDLINAGILAPGEEVTFEPRKGEVYTGQIGRAGELVFGGQRYPKPSSAANALASTSLNGWEYIKVKGRALEEYRNQFIGTARSAVVARTPDGASPTSAPASLAGVPKQPAEDVQSEILAKLNGMSDRQFEEFVGRLLAKLGYAEVDVVGRSGDGGEDVRCVLKGPLIDPPVTVVCQVKRHAANIGPSAVGDLRGRWAHKADRLILVNTGGFTQGAREAASEQGTKQVSLASGEDLADLMIQKGIGVTRQAVVVEKLDQAFFTEITS